MKKKNIVKKNQEFSNIMNKGKKYKCELFSIYVLKNNYAYNKYGISISKKIGNAVVRNTVKRRTKSVIDNLDIKFIGYDVIIIGRSSLKNADYNMIRNNITKVMNMIGETK